MYCEEIMTRNVTVVRPETPCPEIMRLLADDPGRPLLVANEAGFLLGVVTARDFLRLHVARTQADPMAAPSPQEDEEQFKSTIRRIVKLTAKDIMIDSPIVAQVDTSVSSVIVPMVQQRLNFVPVVREGRIEGVIGRAEILHFMLAMIAEAT
ncbi:MAG: CBS domain-containing protein [Patescibacteria group bacterium]